MIFKDMADQIARGIFECGNEHNSPASRIQFMSEKDTDGSEKGQGGLCEASLSMLVEDSIKKYFKSL